MHPWEACRCCTSRAVPSSCRGCQLLPALAWLQQADPELRLAPADALPLSCWRSARLAASAASNSPPGSLWLSFSASPCAHLDLRPVPSTSAGLSPCLCARRGSPATFSWLVQPWGAPGPCSEGPVGCFVSALSPRCSLPPLCRCCGQHGGEAETGRGHPEEAAGSSFGKDQQPQPFCHAVQVKEGCPLCCLTHPEQDSCSGPSKHFWWWVWISQGIANHRCQEGRSSNKVPSPCRSLEPLDPEGPSPPVLSTFLPPVPSTSLDPPEHFPLRKTGEAGGQHHPPLL